MINIFIGIYFYQKDFVKATLQKLKKCGNNFRKNLLC